VYHTDGFVLAIPELPGSSAALPVGTPPGRLAAQSREGAPQLGVRDRMMRNIYADGGYLDQNPTWHEEDSPSA
jgi:hypothetical protein